MRWITFLLIASIALAGCSSGSDEPTTPAGETTTTTATSTTTTATTTTSTGQPEPEENQTAPNTPPSATLSASITNGEAPVEVNFTLDGSDADGDDLTWTFDADEDGVFEAEGSELPATVPFEYATEGVYNATLIISDGTNSTTRGVEINVAAAVAEEGPIATMQLGWELGATDLPGLTDYLSCEAGPANGVTHAVSDLPADVGGHVFVATLTATTGIESVGEWGFYAFDGAACDGSSEEFFSEAPAPVGGGVDGTIEGTIPVGATVIFAYSTGGAGLTLDIVFD